MVETSVDTDILNQIDEMLRCMVEHGFGELGMWQELCEKHTRLLKQRGFANFKRTINFEYHQWGVASFRDAKLRAILKKLLARGRIPLTAFNSRMEMEQHTDLEWPHGRATQKQLLVYKLYVSLMWEYARLHDRLGCLDSVVEPDIGHPIEIYSGNRLISQDLALSTIELNNIARVCDLDHIHKVAEIGAGYGRLAWLILTMRPHIAYSIYDIPPALAISQNYLSQCLMPDRVVPFHAGSDNYNDNGPQAHGGGVACRLPYQMSDVPDRYFDLVINISSFDEMPREEVEKYFDLIDRKLSGWLYLKGYIFNQITSLDYQAFPYRDHWKRVWQQIDPTNDRFIEQIFIVNK